MRPYEKAGREPCLEEVLSDPIVVLLMKKDAVSQNHILSLAAAARARLQTDAEPEVVAWRCCAGERMLGRLATKFTGRSSALERCCA